MSDLPPYGPDEDAAALFLARRFHENCVSGHAYLYTRDREKALRAELAALKAEARRLAEELAAERSLRGDPDGQRRLTDELDARRSRAVHASFRKVRQW